MNGKIKIRQYAILKAPRKFDTADIMCFTVFQDIPQKDFGRFLARLYERTGITIKLPPALALAASAASSIAKC